MKHRIEVEGVTFGKSEGSFLFVIMIMELWETVSGRDNIIDYKEAQNLIQELVDDKPL